MKKTVIIASDHRGFALKEKFCAWLKDSGCSVNDIGTTDTSRCDASDFAHELAKKIMADQGAAGILICGSGQAMAITANRYSHLRAALCTNTTMARLAREHNDANVLVLGADIVGDGLALDCLKVFLETAFLGGRYAERLTKLVPLKQ